MGLTSLDLICILLVPCLNLSFTLKNFLVWITYSWISHDYCLHVLQIYPHGSTDTLPFATMGSGSLAAMSVFESLKYKESLSVSNHIKANNKKPSLLQYRSLLSILKLDMGVVSLPDTVIILVNDKERHPSKLLRLHLITFC